MKLSEAIKSGMEKSLPIRTKLTTRDPEGHLYACALGCAHLGIGGDPDMEDSDIYNAMTEVWSELNNVNVVDEPEMHTDGCKRPLMEAIWIRNDTLKWNRERTLAWLEGMGF